MFVVWLTEDFLDRAAQFDRCSETAGNLAGIGGYTMKKISGVEVKFRDTEELRAIGRAVAGRHLLPSR